MTYYYNDADKILLSDRANRSRGIVQKYKNVIHVTIRKRETLYYCHSAVVYPPPSSTGFCETLKHIFRK